MSDKPQSINNKAHGNSIIQFEDVWKQFRLYTQRSRSLKELVIKPKKFTFQEFWALKGVTFDIKEGETFGMVGENGSGKSTALKLLSRIYKPTKGNIYSSGKISGLIELGAGFHPELTGRENIYLNAAILGLSKKQVTGKLDEIIGFAELEKFIDNPVKNYSSGMQVRLGFSVAIHVDPDILLIDEVLAVGDEHFQRKCADKIIEFKKGNKTIIIVSHILEELRNLCDRAAWLHNGELQETGEAGKVIDNYLNLVNRQESEFGESRAEAIESQFGQRWGSHEAEITKVEFFNDNGQAKRIFKTNDPVTVRIRYNSHKKIEKPVFGVAIHRTDGAHITGPNTKVAGIDIPFIDGEGEVEFKINKLNLLKGNYLFSAAIYDESCLHPYDHHGEMYFFEVVPGTIKETYGMVTLDSEWTIK
jgi:lipopolysaccharide transport system ATP-binding protein